MAISKHLTNRGYIRLYKPGGIYKGNRYIMEHVWIMAEYIGRKLLPYERIHHINGNKSDNRIDNLMLLTSSEHSTLHNNEHYAMKHPTLGFRKGHKIRTGMRSSQETKQKLSKIHILLSLTRQRDEKGRFISLAKSRQEI